MKISASNETVKDRLLKFLEHSNISQGRFEKAIGVSNGYINNVKSIGSDKLSLITTEYPQINITWLLTGKGDMFMDLKLDDDIYIRFKQIIEYIGKQIDEISFDTLIPGEDFEDILKGQVKPNIDILQQICNAYPEINLSWLLTGEGVMLKNNERIPPGDLLQLYLKEKGITKEEFANKMGISLEEADKHFNLKDGNMDYMLQWAMALGTKTTELFMSADTYLMYMERESREAKGNMQNAAKPFRNEVTPVPESEYMMVEYVDLRASAGRLGGMPVDQLPETHKRLVPKEYAKGKYLVVGVDGDSMNDGTARSLAAGDEVLVYQHEGGVIDSLPIRKTLFVITTRDGNVLKQITEINREEKYITCHSFNPAYEDFKVYFEDIYQVFIVCKIVQKQISLT